MFLIDVGPPTCANGWGKARAYPVRFAIASKGEIHFELAAGAQCVNEGQDLAARAADADVHGHGGHRDLRRCIGHRHRRAFSRNDEHGCRRDRDVDRHPHRAGPRIRCHAAPTLAGAANKTVRAKKGAKSARVAFRVTAQDDTGRHAAGRVCAQIRKPLPDSVGRR